MPTSTKALITIISSKPHAHSKSTKNPARERARLPAVEGILVCRLPFCRMLNVACFVSHASAKFGNKPVASWWCLSRAPGATVCPTRPHKPWDEFSELIFICNRWGTHATKTVANGWTGEPPHNGYFAFFGTKVSDRLRS